MRQSRNAWLVRQTEGFHARLHSCPGATRRAPGNGLGVVVTVAQGMDHLLQALERA